MLNRIKQQIFVKEKIHTLTFFYTERQGGFFGSKNLKHT